MSILKRAFPFLIGITLLFTLASCEVRLSGKYGPDLTTYETADITAGEFIFSKNILNTSTPHYAFFVDQSQFGLVTDSGTVVYNCNAEAIVYSSGDTTCLDYGKAYLQKLYDDLDQR
jgi:hypothetical protein